MNGSLGTQFFCWPPVNVQFTANRRRFDAMSSGLDEYVRAARMAMLGALFDELPPTWLVGRDCRVLDANAPAAALAAAGAAVAIVEGHLCPAVAEGKQRLAAALVGLKDEGRFSWPAAGQNGEASLRLRALADGGAVAVTLRQPQDPIADVAPRLAGQFGIPHRQSQLAAHLLAGHSLSAAAHAMEISRATASEHLASLQKRLGQPSRQALLAHLLTGYR